MSRRPLLPPRHDPMILRSFMVISTGGATVSVCSRFPAPTSTVVPPLRVDSTHVLIATVEPTASNASSTPMPPVSACTRPTTSSAVGSITSVAPNRIAFSRRSPTGSETMMRVAPAMRAPCTIEMPMPPAPTTSTVAPSGTRAVLSTAPTPVCTAHPITHTIVERRVVGHLDRTRHRRDHELGEAREARRRAARARRDARAACARRSASPT